MSLTVQSDHNNLCIGDRGSVCGRGRAPFLNTHTTWATHDRERHESFTKSKPISKLVNFLYKMSLTHQYRLIPKIEKNGTNPLQVKMGSGRQKESEGGNNIEGTTE